MSEKEILAEYKIAYLQLEDIIDNADPTQITKDEQKQIQMLMDTLAKLYRELYERIKDMEDISLYYEEDLLISDEISGDYIDTTDGEEYITYKDIDNESKWWEDYDFLTEF